MVHHRQSDPVAGASPRYRITPGGKAVTDWERHPVRTRHLLDVLDLLHRSSHGVAEAHLRQFMPAESLMRALSCLLALGLIEFTDVPAAPQVAQQQGEVFRRS